MISHSLMTQTPRIRIEINNLVLNQVIEIKFLGIVIDNTLRWRLHVYEIKNKIV